MMGEVTYNFDGSLNDTDSDDDDDPCTEEILHYENINSLTHAIGKDDMPTMVLKLRQMYCMHHYCPSYIMECICSRDAVTCATVLLEGKAGLHVDLNVPFSDGAYPLHMVASKLNYDLVKLLLSHGARTDVRDSYDSSFPVNSALEKLCHHKCLFYWTPEESIYKLVIILCLPQMKVPLETIRLLALDIKDVNELILNYAKEGKLIQMAALLMVANERVMAPNTFQCMDGATIKGNVTMCDIIMEEIEFQAYEKSEALVGIGERTTLMFSLILLKIFERVGGAIRSYLQSQTMNVSKEQVVNDVAYILREASFVLKDKDTDLMKIDWSDEVKDALGTSENMTYMSHDYVDMLLRQSNIRKVAKKEGPKDSTSILKEAISVLKDMDIDLSNIYGKVFCDSESDEIEEEAMGTSENIAAYNSETYFDMIPDPLDGLFLNAKVEPNPCNPMTRLLNPQFHQFYQRKVFNTPRSVPLTSYAPLRHCARLISTCAVFELQKNQCNGANNAMQRCMLLASLAASFKRGIRRL